MTKPQNNKGTFVISVVFVIVLVSSVAMSFCIDVNSHFGKGYAMSQFMIVKQSTTRDKDITSSRQSYSTATRQNTWKPAGAKRYKNRMKDWTKKYFEKGPNLSIGGLCCHFLVVTVKMFACKLLNHYIMPTIETKYCRSQQPVKTSF